MMQEFPGLLWQLQLRKDRQTDAPFNILVKTCSSLHVDHQAILLSIYALKVLSSTNIEKCSSTSTSTNA